MARLVLADYVHRGVVTTLVGITLYGMVAGGV